jgi:Leucine-rich repeat (LRR) protein
MAQEISIEVSIMYQYDGSYAVDSKKDFYSIDSIEVNPKSEALFFRLHNFTLNDMAEFSEKTSRLKNVKSIFLENYEDSTVNGEFFELHPELTKFYVSGGNLTCLPDDFYQLDSLKSVSIYSELTEYKFDQPMYNLEMLTLDENHLRECFIDLKNFPKLRVLGLAKNQLQSLSIDSTENSSLFTLLLWGNSLEELPSELCKLPNLQNISFNENSLTDLPDCLIPLLERSYMFKYKGNNFSKDLEKRLELLQNEVERGK